LSAPSAPLLRTNPVPGRTKAEPGRRGGGDSRRGEAAADGAADGAAEVTREVTRELLPDRDDLDSREPSERESGELADPPGPRALAPSAARARALHGRRAARRGGRARTARVLEAPCGRGPVAGQRVVARLQSQLDVWRRAAAQKPAPCRRAARGAPAVSARRTRRRPAPCAPSAERWRLSREQRQLSSGRCWHGQRSPPETGVTAAFTARKRGDGSVHRPKKG
jgi:hypothetical protein